MMTQSQQIRSHLRRGWPITALDALRKYGCLRLAARIGELRAAGNAISVERVLLDNGKRVAKYRMARARVA